MASNVGDPHSQKPHFRFVGQRENLVDRVVRTIESKILDGRLPQGTRIPCESELTRDLGVSRPVVREAVRILVGRGLLETRQGVGTKVRAVTHAEVLKPLTLFLRTCGQEVNVAHLHAVRLILEVEAAAMAAEEATDADIARLAQIYCEMESAAGDPQQFIHTDFEFHRCVGESTHNALMVVLLDSVQRLTSEVRAVVNWQLGSFEHTLTDHRRILEGIKSRDQDAARLATHDHLSRSFTVQKEMIERAKA
jgi:GntR family transcriptional repressor for pyruvate dehydrogenase complex